MNKFILLLNKLVKKLKERQVVRLTTLLETTSDAVDCADDKFIERIKFAEQLKLRAEMRAEKLYVKERNGLNKTKQHLSSKLEELESI